MLEYWKEKILSSAKMWWGFSHHFFCASHVYDTLCHAGQLQATYEYICFHWWFKECARGQSLGNFWRMTGTKENDSCICDGFYPEPCRSAAFTIVKRPRISIFPSTSLAIVGIRQDNQRNEVIVGNSTLGNIQSYQLQADLEVDQRNIILFICNWLKRESSTLGSF